MVGPSGAQLTLLGHWHLSTAGRSLVMPEPARRLMASLALRGPATRRQLADRLFPDLSQERSAARLRDQLSRMPERDLLIVHQADGRVALHEGVQVDLVQLSAALTRLRRGDRHALDAVPWHVDLLTGWDDDWVASAREHLCSNVFRSLLAFCAQVWCSGSIADAMAAVMAADRALQLAPLDERAARWLIRCHLALGDQALALRVWTDLQKRLEDELGAAPEPATQALVVSIRRAGVELSRQP